MNSKVTFSFGKNWVDFNKYVTDEEILQAQEDLVFWIGKNNITGKRILDLGCGSGIHSLCFFNLGAGELISFDYDPFSVSATREYWEKKNKPSNWTILQGSVLDKDFIDQMGIFDLVYSWGVLHHTGSMWQAMNNALGMVKDNGLFYLTIYKDNDYEHSIKVKEHFNASSAMGKKWVIYQEVMKLMARRALSFKNPFTWNRKLARGMNIYHDLVDWLGGLPYEAASEDEILQWGIDNKLQLKRIWCSNGKGSCNYYLFQR